jgi:hypothetical protein
MILYASVFINYWEDLHSSKDHEMLHVGAGIPQRNTLDDATMISSSSTRLLGDVLRDDDGAD